VKQSERCGDTILPAWWNKYNAMMLEMKEDKDKSQPFQTIHNI